MMRKNMNQHVIFDGRNIFEPEEVRAEGFDYFSIGR
jgi:UDPglucose 6-dehydrogenase